MESLDALLLRATASLSENMALKKTKVLEMDAGSVPSVTHVATVLPNGPHKVDSWATFVPSVASSQLTETLQILGKRGALDTKRHYKKVKIGKNVQLGNIVGMKKSTMSRELIASKAHDVIKRRVLQVEEERNNVTRKKKFIKKK